MLREGQQRLKNGAQGGLGRTLTKETYLARGNKKAKHKVILGGCHRQNTAAVRALETGVNWKHRVAPTPKAVADRDRERKKREDGAGLGWL